MVTMPVPKGFYVTSKFGQRTGQYAGMHWGTDFGNGGGSGGKPIYAVKDGTVTRSGPASGFGQWITVDHPASNGGGLTVYGHIIPEVRVGQQVKEGQRIGYINPDSATNGGVAPHLHLEWHRYVWAQPGADRLDPMTKLAGARWVGDTTPPSTGGSMTTFGVDISGHQDGFALRHAKAAGAEFAILKATEGHTFRDKVFHSHLKDARANGMIVAAYLYVWHNSTPAQMAQTFADYVNDTSVPAILDIENNSGRSVAHWNATITELNKRGYKTPLVYLPRWYWQQVGSPSLAGLPPLWSSNYPSGGGEMKGTYARAGGDTGAGWAGYGGLNVAMWQFTEGASIAGWGMDANAYKGTRADLEKLLTGKTTTAPLTPKETTVSVNYPKLALEQLAGSGEKNGEPTFTGWGIEDLITKGRANLQTYGSATLPQMLAIAHADTFRAIINEGKK
jgi:GH25 family lysozyme M1 (1,4-beta-N-acetylmuramidase)